MSIFPGPEKFEIVGLPDAGGARPDVIALAHKSWVESAAKSGIDLSDFNFEAPLIERLKWAESRGLDIAAVLARFSMHLQHSTEAQVRDNVSYAAAHRMYVPPEFICVDEGITGRKASRGGLNRLKLILEQRLIDVLIVFKISRLFRVAYRGFQFIQEEIVDAGLRAISISQGIDTADEKTWKMLAYMHGMMDEMFISTVADHVRSGIEGLFRKGHVVGALPVGYVPKEVIGALPTNLGRPRMAPAIDSDAAKLIVQHFVWIRDGMPIREGWRRWVAANGPSDPRSKSSQISRSSYRRMLSNCRYTGRWAFGQKRNVWNTKRDCVVQIGRPESEVIFIESNELRIVDDELFFAVQKRLNNLKTGHRSPRKQKSLQLWDLVTDCFICAKCGTEKKLIRFYQAGANGHGMQCKHGDLCPCKTVVRRKDAVRAICEQLNKQLQSDRDLILKTIICAQKIEATDDEGSL